MKMNKKIKIITMVALCTALVPLYKTFADKLDDAFRGGTKIEYREYGLGISHYVQRLKFAWASTRKEENGHETYEGYHYLRCYRENLFGKKEGDTDKVYKTKGFYIESGKFDVTDMPLGGFKAFYGNE